MTPETEVSLFAATRAEQRALLAAGTGLPVLRSGVGRARALRARRTATAGAVAGTAVAGIAGGVAPDLRPGDVVVAERIVTDPPGGPEHRLPSAPLLARALRAAGLTVHVGTVASTALPVLTAAGRRRLAERGVLAVDMESAWLLGQDTPGAVVRVVADPATDPVLRPRTLARARVAARRLTAVAPAIHAWAAAVGPRQVLLAEPQSFCAGVERAIEVVERALEQRGAPVYVRKQIVHNQHVVRTLEERGAVFVDDLAEVPGNNPVIFSAHGVSPAVREQARSRDLDVVDATCPLVTKVHAEVRRFADRGDTVLFIGHPGHEETEGTVGERPGRTIVVDGLEAARTVEVPDPERVSYLVQTTLSLHDVEEIVAVLRDRFPALQAPPTDDICYATTNRQNALGAVAAEADLVLAVGSENSSNTRRLVETAERLGTPAHLIEDETELELTWLAGVGTVAVTAGASAPAYLVDRVVTALRGLGPATVHSRNLVTETTRFALPKEVRS